MKKILPGHAISRRPRTLRAPSTARSFFLPEIASTILAAVFLLLASTGASAWDERYHNVGIGLKSLIIGNDLEEFADDEWGGLEVFLSGSAPGYEWLALNANLYYLVHEEVSDFKAMGVEGEIQAGLNLVYEGFKIYGILGFYAENWSNGDFDEDFAGGHAGGGIGYNWDQVSLDLSLRIRTTDDYDDLLQEFFGPGVDATAGTASLSIGYRF